MEGSMRVYYNEIDPYCCLWLENLMKSGQIPMGDIDSRDIRDVKPEELSSYDHCHFFAGLGGWAKAYKDQPYNESGMWTGSCPCQPFSVAGKNKGFEDERDLWPAWFQLIAQCLPRTVFGEQVAGKAGLGWFKRLQADVATVGYGSAAFDLPAGGFGAIHKRSRLYFVAENSAHTKRNEQPREEPCYGEVRRVGRFKQPFPWDTSWESALRRIRVMDDGLSYGVASTDAARNAICPQVGKAFIEASYESKPWDL
jgi:DNA (cytosine-5)-methyltransferase 1